MLPALHIDYDTFLLAARAWTDGRDPYGELSEEFAAGRFPYPPTFLAWTALLLPFGVSGFYALTLAQFGLWAHLMKRSGRAQWPLLVWSPLLLHVYIGQMTLPMVLVLWWAHLAREERLNGSAWRSLAWGLAMAWCCTKPQIALLPLGALLWEERRAWQTRWLVLGLVAGTLLLIAPTARDPQLWLNWWKTVRELDQHIVYQAAWQGASVGLLALAAWLWRRRSQSFEKADTGVVDCGNWRWWLTACAYPQSTFYALIALLPAMNVTRNRWHLLGLLMAAVGQVQTAWTPLPWLLAWHALAAWMVTGGAGVRIETRADARGRFA